HLVVTTFLLLAVLALYFWMRQESLSVWQSAAVSLIFALMPTTYFISLDIWTEDPYLFFSLLAILGVSLAARKENHKWLWLAAFAVACATLVRVAAISILLAFWFFLALRRPKNYLYLMTVSALPFVLWSILGAITQIGVSGYANGLMKIYLTPEFFTILFHQLYIGPVALFVDWKFGWLGYTQPPVLAFVVTAFGAICLAGWLYRLRYLKFDAIYVAIYLAMVFLWPNSGPLRYLSMLNPVFIAHGFLLVAGLSKNGLRIGNSAIVSATLAVVLLLTLLPTFVINGRYFLQPVPADIRIAKHMHEWYDDNRESAILSAYFQARLISHLKEINALIPENECVFAIKPTIVTFYSRRSSYSPPKIEASEEEFWKGIKKCRYAYILPVSSASFTQPLYPLARLGNGAKIISVKKKEAGDDLPPIGILAEIIK
ncbi:MAG: ArnT family glycosyltransferase, partial [Burkholderiales bacterium]